MGILSTFSKLSGLNPTTVLLPIAGVMAVAVIGLGFYAQHEAKQIGAATAACTARIESLAAKQSRQANSQITTTYLAEIASLQARNDRLVKALQVRSMTDQSLRSQLRDTHIRLQEVLAHDSHARSWFDTPVPVAVRYSVLDGSPNGHTPAPSHRPH